MKKFLSLANIFNQSRDIFIELRGGRVVLAEGYCRIESFSEKVIVLESELDKIAVRGSNLTLSHLSSGRIAVKGEISTVEYL